MGCGITKVDYYLPEKVLTNEELAKVSGRWSAAKIEKKVGVRERHIAAENQFALDLAYEASLKVLNGYDKTNIDLVVLCTQTPDYFLPSTACLLQDKLGLRTDIGAFDINMGCSGYIYGLAATKGFINAGIANRVLFVTTDTYSRFIHEKDFSNLTIIGDGATATIVEKSNEERVLEFTLGTDGSGWDNLIVPYGALRHRYDPNAEIIEDESGNLRTGNHFYMNGPEVFNFTIEEVPKVVAAVLEKNQLEMADIDYVIFHQANKYMIEYLRKKIKIPEEKFCINMLHSGNTVSSTIPIALKDTLDKGIVKKGDKVLLCAFGVGYSWGAVIVKL